MVVKTSSTKEKEQWLGDNISLVRRFRFLLNEAKNNPNPAKRINFEKKIKHVQRKIDDLANKGKVMGLSEEQIKNINLEVVRMTENGETVRTIKEKLEERL